MRAAHLAVLGMVALWMLGLGPPTGAQPAPAAERPGTPGPRVLLLYSEPRLTPAIVAVDTTMRSTLEAQSSRPVSFYTEYLDLTLFEGTVPAAELRELLRRKYAARPIDVIVAAGSRTLRIALRNRADLFGGAPVVFTAVDPAAAADLRLEGDVTGTWLHLGWSETLDLARQLQPDIRRAVVVTGAARPDQVWMAAARKQLAAPGGGIEVIFRSGPALDEFAAEAKTLPAGTIILTGPFFRDGTGRDVSTAEAATRIAAAASVPVYTLTEATVGTGTVGGQVVDFAGHGRVAAELALRVLSGERPPPTETGTTLPMFDARQLARWGLDARRVPAGSRILFDEPSVWARYRWYILGAVAVLMAQSGLIGALLVQRVQRRRAQDRSAELAGRLMSAQEEERRRIARDLHDDVTQELAAQSIALSALTERMPEDAAEDVREDLARLQGRTVEMAKTIRDLSHSLHPGVLQHAGLVAALRGYCRGFERKHGVPVSFQVDGDLGIVPPDVALCLYRVTQEGLGNVAQHAAARQARVMLGRDGAAVTLTIWDDGRGFDPIDARRRQGLGLISLDERARLIGARLTIDSRVQRGTELRIVVPLAEVRDATPDRAAR
ncbi:MAG TPA: histidine kinase [Methylomirabilota bacterium]|nr:histidine kinase [Methylomirabilota bacterium]